MKRVLIRKLVKENDQNQKDFFDAFSATPIRVDPDLEGKIFYMAVSQELFDELPQKDNLC